MCKSLAVLLAFTGITASGSARPGFPIEFEARGSAWIARGPAYELVLQGGNAFLSTSNEAGRVSRIGMHIEGAPQDAVGMPEEESTGRRNYLTGTNPRQWRTNVRVWKRVRFHAVQPGIDIVYRGADGRLEFDLEVAPGADPRAVTFAWTGADHIRLDSAGNLVLHTEAGDLVERKPVAYQMAGSTRRTVRAAFRIQGERVSFDLGPYNRAAPLVIDPIVDYSTWFPGPITLIAADNSGAAYVSGSIPVPVLPATPGAFQQICGTDGFCNMPGYQVSQQTAIPDVFIAKFSPDGSTLVYCTYLGGSGADIPAALIVDGSGNVIVGGSTTSVDFPLTPGLNSFVARGASNGFVTKLNADGSALVWSTLTPTFALTDAALDQSGNLFFLANTIGLGTFTTPNPPFPFWAVTDNLLMACDAFISCGFQRDEDTSEVNTQWVRNKISHSSSRSTLR